MMLTIVFGGIETFETSISNLKELCWPVVNMFVCQPGDGHGFDFISKCI